MDHGGVHPLPRHEICGKFPWRVGRYARKQHVHRGSLRGLGPEGEGLLVGLLDCYGDGKIRSTVRDQGCLDCMVQVGFARPYGAK